MDKGGGGFDEGVVFDCGWGRLGVGGFVEGGEGVWGEVGFLDVGGRGLCGDIRVVGSEGMRMEDWKGEYGFVVFRIVFIVFDDGDGE